jgi:hypothetical protein
VAAVLRTWAKGKEIGGRRDKWETRYALRWRGKESFVLLVGGILYFSALIGFFS